jgi:acetyltransferase-like isoleucine patch superfamily enzyme
VQRLARAYDLRVEPALRVHGQHPLILADPIEVARHAIPRSVYFNTRSGSITIGHDTVFGEDVKVLTGKHMHISEARAAGVEQHHVPESGRDIVIGSGCYVGSGAILIGPVTIGDHAMIGAGAVVTADVPPYGFAVGVPARVVRMLDVPAAN